ncbi:hypothetical protein N0V90_003779 [Kalmusia sp. IMI 367209]|nr:hypothetical protein N0V90_003779 [Kalmusia sp. IMI 367209]
MLVSCPLLPRDDSQRYFALSYVWGTADFFKTTRSNVDSLSQPGGLDQPHISLPNTFRDAMKLVEQVGERYIWIDALCIVQDDKMKHDQLNIMDQIYGRAYLTIVSLAGNNVHYGLPGVHLTERKKRPLRGHFKGGDFITALPSLQQAIQKSPHFSRAWTFQETLLSQRCLFVSEGQLFFRCPRDSFAEGPDWQAKISPGISFQLGLASTRNWHQDIYHSSVEQYTQRYLSYDEDILNAFMGALERMKYMGYHSRGDMILDLPAPDSLLWFSVDRNASRRSRSANSEDLFPSWSWVGWEGAVTYASLKFGRNISTFTATLRSRDHVKLCGEETFSSLPQVDRVDSEPFCTKPHCSRLLQLPTGEYRTSSRNPGANLLHLHLYRFCASVCAASKFTLSSWGNYAHSKSTPHINIALLQILDEKGKKCGAFFNPPLASLETSELYKYALVAISMKKQYDWLEDISTPDYDTKDPVENSVSGCGCWLNVMLVRFSMYDGITERMAIGQMHPRAFVEAEPVVEMITLM